VRAILHGLFVATGAGMGLMDTIKCNDIIDMNLSAANAALSKHFGADVIILKGPMKPPVDDIVKDAIEELKSPKDRSRPRSKLVVMLETNGGYVEVVEHIASVFRHHYKTVEFIVPHHAYSAGTLLVLSGDEIYMDYYSVLGPIDPRFDMDGINLPGMGYLAKYTALVKAVNAAEDPASVRAELAILINKFDPAILFTIEQAIEQSKSLVREWLPKYKFKAWKVKKTSRKRVTKADKRKRAEQIATILGDAERWHSHGRGITMKILTSEEIRLNVVNYGENETMYQNISQYYGLFKDYIRNRHFESAIHSERGLRRLG
jgi:hypothetical protein